jgi:CARDB
MSGGCTVWAVLIGLIGGSAFAGASVRPDLVETAVSVSQHAGALRVTDVVRNLGGTAAPPSATGYYLARRRIGGRSVGRLPPRAVARGSKTLTIPSSVTPGSYRLLVCADRRDRIRESDERNNCRAASRLVEVGDRTPPRFAGLTRATTCIPGPVGGEARSTHYYLQWEPAVDRVTPPSEIVYDVYQANAPSAEEFSAPTYTTTAGATSFTTTLLPDDMSYYFVVRARDKVGNRDANEVERLGVNLCL